MPRRKKPNAKRPQAAGTPAEAGPVASTAARPAEAPVTPPFHAPPELRGVDVAVLERFRQDAMAQEESRMRSQRLADIAAVVAFLEGRDGHAPEDPTSRPADAAPTAHVQAAAGASSRSVPSLAPVRFTPAADLLVSPRPPARSVSAVPRDALVGALAMLDAVSLARCRRVCKEWRDASGNERLWRRHCRRVCRLNMDRDLFDKTRAQAKALHSWRLAYPRVPQVHSTGIYVLRGGYFRQPYRDAWHDPPPFLHCIYHRVLALRPDGSLLYGNIPGPVADAVKRIRRVAAFTTAAKATNPAVVAAALLDESQPEGLFDRLVVSRMVMAFSPGTTAEDAMHAALAADGAESSDDDSDTTPSDVRPSRAAGLSRGFRWPESDEADIQIDSLGGLCFEFLPVDGL
ncbi:hypothetical protein FNF29_05191 [Cafeteria roenbergensis]|uniref:F-box domain-containing protein n=1 Tax=Cafeteria roenbergensis TaxID=33653 RepID=A0A5A8CC08_CAFRO|nr:hypothetical protein FNF29_05191 [Cafeteria roenbergensis]|eukprot:KAA0150616.1 hypothetical protein FNF29_05191 [Cafeteria roenbergensis]